MTDKPDIVERLRAFAELFEDRGLHHEAADEIERLRRYPLGDYLLEAARAEIERLREIIKRRDDALSELTKDQRPQTHNAPLDPSFAKMDGKL